MLNKNQVSTFKKPMFSLFVQLEKDCGLELFVNDIPVTPSSFFSGGPTSTYIPINQYLKPSNNIYSVVAWSTKKLLPDKKYEANCSVTLVVWDFSTMQPNSSDAVSLGKFTISMVEGGKIKNITYGRQSSEVIDKMLEGQIESSKIRGVEVGPVQLENEKDIGWWVKREFEPGFNIPSSKWQNSEKITDTSQTKESVIKMYQSLKIFHQLHNFEGWKRVNLEKDTETALLTHTTVEQLWEHSTQLPPLLRGEDKEWELKDVDLTTAKMRIVADGQLVTLLIDWRPVIKYISKADDNYAIRVPIYLRREGKGWVISR